jgi:hypothetical protein
MCKPNQVSDGEHKNKNCVSLFNNSRKIKELQKTANAWEQLKVKA